jgi:hypothetical protein
MQWLLALVFRCMRRRDDRSLAFFTPPLLGDKVSGNLEYSLLRRTRLYFFASDEVGAITGQAFSIDGGTLA